MADFDDDGLKDLVVANKGDSTVTSAEHHRDSRRPDHVYALRLYDHGRGSPGWRDHRCVQRSANSDFAVVYASPTSTSTVESTVQVFLGNGNLTFQPPFTFDAGGTNPTSITVP